jgi:NitT/TauT family transport system ATP-binding protein
MVAAGRVLIEEVSIRYRGARGKGIEALTATTLTLEPGSFTSLIGPSGCGKSTLLNAVAGFVPTSTGSIRVDGRPVHGPNPEIGIVFQQYALFPWFTAVGNILFALKRFPMNAAERHEKAMTFLDEVGLADKARNFPGQLSGGMKQRVALARTLASNPTVLLMDEPFGALDAQTRISMQILLLQIWETHRKTVLFVTHDVDEALLLSDRAHVMSAAPGRIVETIEIQSARPRSVDNVDESYLVNRNRIMRLLHHGDE